MSDVIEKDCFQLKADFFPMTVFKFSDSNIELLTSQLSNTIEKAPKYLMNAPIVLDVKDLAKNDDVNIPEICRVLRDKNIIPVGIRGLDDKNKLEAKQNGLAIIQPPRGLNLAEGTVGKKKDKTPATTMIINKPVRSGSQIYAKGCDLIVLSSVNPGAEIIADGNIHVYGPLKGRALAGASGNKDARIFCESIECELVAIAGHYLISDQIKAPKTNKPIYQIYLDGDGMKIDGI